MATRKRSRRGRWARRLLALLLLAGLVAAGTAWWRAQHWTPDAAVYPDQGVHVGELSGEVNLRTARALGAGFVYLDASIGGDGKDRSFTRNFESAQQLGLPVGAVHHFDPCIPADPQSANFVTIVPREAALLPPAIAMDKLAEECPQRVSEAAVASELTTLVNQIEIHAGRPAILKPSRAFERAYGIAGRIERNLWLTSNWTEPSYGGRPWLLWTANDALVSEVSDEPVAWVAVRPSGDVNDE